MIRSQMRLTRSKVNSGINDENAIPVAIGIKNQKVTLKSTQEPLKKVGLTENTGKGLVKEVKQPRAILSKVSTNVTVDTENKIPVKALQKNNENAIPPLRPRAALVPTEVKLEHVRLQNREVNVVIEQKRPIALAKSNIPIHNAIKIQPPIVPAADIRRVLDEIVQPKIENAIEKEVVAPRTKKLRTIEPPVQDWDDLDAEDADDPMMMSEYVVEIFEYMKEIEIQTMPNPTYMDDQRELQWKMRGILVDWLIDVHNKFHLLAETLFLAINIIDRFLSNRIVSLNKLQLVGITALFIASKYEEVVAPALSNFQYMADGGYSDEEILTAERYILQVLDFSLQYPSPLSFLRRCSKAEQYDMQSRTLAKYFMEITLVDQNFLHIKPSLVAASSLYLARRMLDKIDWDANLRHYSSYTEEQVQEPANLLCEYLLKPVKHESLYKKYSGRKFLKASEFARNWIRRNNQREVQDSDEL